jgi:hypothetical protein
VPVVVPYADGSRYARKFPFFFVCWNASACVDPVAGTFRVEFYRRQPSDVAVEGTHLRRWRRDSMLSIPPGDHPIQPVDQRPIRIRELAGEERLSASVDVLQHLAWLALEPCDLLVSHPRGAAAASAPVRKCEVSGDVRRKGGVEDDRMEQALVSAAHVFVEGDDLRTLHEEPEDVADGCSPGTTALHAAARSEDVRSVVLLLEHGADPALVDGDGRTPVGIATAAGHAAVVEILRGAGARDRSGTAHPECAETADGRGEPHAHAE